MHPSPRIPTLINDSLQAMSDWFSAMYAEGILFHPDDHPDEICWIDDDERVFTDIEASLLKDTIARLFALHGDQVYEAAYPYFMWALHGENWAIKSLPSRCQQFR